MGMQILGEFLIELGLVGMEELEEALEIQNREPVKKLGQILVEKGYLTPGGLERALNLQKHYREHGPDKNREQIKGYLRRVHLFDGLSDSDLETVAGACYEEAFLEDHTLFNEGEVGDALYVVIAGAVRLVKSSPQGQEQELAVIGMGDFLGEMALIDKGPRSASALIKRNTTLLVLSKRQLDILMERDHEIALKIYRIFATTLSERLRTANARVTELANKVRAAGVYEPGIHIRPPK